MSRKPRTWLRPELQAMVNRLSKRERSLWGRNGYTVEWITNYLNVKDKADDIVVRTSKTDTQHKFAAMRSELLQKFSTGSEFSKPTRLLATSGN